MPSLRGSGHGVRSADRLAHPSVASLRLRICSLVPAAWLRQAKPRGHRARSQIRTSASANPRAHPLGALAAGGEPNASQDPQLLRGKTRFVREANCLGNEDELAEEVAVEHALLRLASLSERKDGIDDRAQGMLTQELHEVLELGPRAHHGTENGKLS